METGPPLAVFADGEREFEFHPVVAVATREPVPESPVDTRLSFITGSFGRTPTEVAEVATPAPTEIVNHSRWGVGYIAGVGPTELVSESPIPAFELVGSTSLFDETPVSASRELRGWVSVALAAMILIVVGLAWFVTSSSSRTATSTPSVKSAPPPAQAPSSVPNSVVTQPPADGPSVPPAAAPPAAPAAAPVAAPVRHYTSVAKTVVPAPVVKAPAPVVQPPAPAAPPTTGNNHHGGPAFAQHHHGSGLFPHS